MSKIKNAMLEKEEKKQVKVKKQTKPNLPASVYENPWLEAAAEAGNPLGKLMKYVKGKWMVGDDEVPIGTEFIAHIDQLCRGWVPFKNGELAGEPIIKKIADGGRLPTREELGDNDPTKWEEDSDGKPRDPWVEQWYLPLVKVDSTELFTFITGSDGGDQVIGNLCGVYGRKVNESLLPIVALGSGGYKHKKYGRVETPELSIVGWHGAAPPAPAAPF